MLSLRKITNSLKTNKMKKYIVITCIILLGVLGGCDPKVEPLPYELHTNQRIEQVDSLNSISTVISRKFIIDRVCYQDLDSNIVNKLKDLKIKDSIIVEKDRMIIGNSIRVRLYPALTQNVIIDKMIYSEDGYHVNVFDKATYIERNNLLEFVKFLKKLKPFEYFLTVIVSVMIAFIINGILLLIKNWRTRLVVAISLSIFFFYLACFTIIMVDFLLMFFVMSIAIPIILFFFKAKKIEYGQTTQILNV